MSTTDTDRVDFWTLLGRADARDAVTVPREVPHGGAVLALNSVVLSLQMAAAEGDDTIVAYVRAFLEEEADVPSVATVVNEAPVPLTPAEAGERLHSLDPQIANPQLLMERVFKQVT